MPTINTEVYVGYVDVEVDLNEVDTEDLVKELESRDVSISFSDDITDLINSLYQKRQLGKDYSCDLDEIIYRSIGRIS